MQAPHHSHYVAIDMPIINGRYRELKGERYYEISNYDRMLPFFISLASHSDHWMYLSSRGGLSAGRRSPDQALFPYYTDDKINESEESTGSKTLIQVEKDGSRLLWEPFSNRYKGIYRIERSIAKATTGNKIIFTEVNHDLQLSFAYEWMNSERFGWIKKSTLSNLSKSTTRVYLVDGLQNILPAGIDRLTQNTYSTLVDAYKKTELIAGTPLALFRMESILVDRAEPSESLRTNTVWCHGLPGANYLLSFSQLDSIREGHSVMPERESKGVRGAFFACIELEITADSEQSWYMIAETNQDACAVMELIDFLEKNTDPAAELEADVAKGTAALVALVANADGIQQGADEHLTARHFSNVLFNLMRGGIYNDNYHIRSTDFLLHIRHFNHGLAERQASFLNSLPVEIDYSQLEQLVLQQNDSDLYRLFLEYLPLTFSRRHGDPSRPWNIFNIRLKDEAGNKLLSYQGNWRDIFQNWEALSHSFPGYINGIIAKFLNASTADGYNPYKLTHEGIEWEVIEPDNPWSNIGYWGDHQIIYLLKLMEVSRKFFPGKLSSWLDEELFAYANVPYRIKSYADIVANPKNTLVYDEVCEQQIAQLLPTYGADAKLIIAPNGEVLRANLTEKLLITLLTKLSNFIPEAGIWMNTLRPEWNDANNALVGSGASMVTLYYMRRYVVFVKELYQETTQVGFMASTELRHFFDQIFDAFRSHALQINKGFNDTHRRGLTDLLGNAGENYRTHVYAGFGANKQLIERKELLMFFDISLQYIDQSIDANKRSDNMYHAYNLVNFSEGKISIRRLYEMLEGQVAVLSSGKLNSAEVVHLLDALRQSSLYRADQRSYILYPNKQLPTFLEKNHLKKEEVREIRLLQELLYANNKDIIREDIKGGIHFHADFHNAAFLREALIKLQKKNEFSISEEDIQKTEALYEKHFDHQSFTGRSGTFYKYEGLGCIYWHMVSKLLLVIAENIQKADPKDTVRMDQLKLHYQEVKEGIGAHKSPSEYGSFPFDPYSHTPMMAGVQQPGMTGQVKEDILSRFFELGVQVEKGCISFLPLANELELIIEKGTAPYLQFSFCGTTIRYQYDGAEGVDIHYADARKEQLNHYQLDADRSRMLFNRTGEISRLIVHFRRK